MSPDEATDFEKLVQLLSAAGVEFIIVGGVAAFAHGSATSTQDLDVVYQRTAENVRRMVSALAAHSPYPRDTPPGLPFQWDDRTVKLGLNFTLDTDLGFIDLLGEITGGGSYHQLLSHTVEMELFGVNCRCLNLDELIRVKRAAGRPKDFNAVAELEALREEKSKTSQPPPPDPHATPEGNS